MKKILSVLFSVMFAAVSMFSYSAFAKKDDKVAVCHNLGNGEYVVIVVSEKAADMHYNQHEDEPFLGGSCGLAPPE
jgi:putative cell wall-binding protein